MHKGLNVHFPFPITGMTGSAFISFTNESIEDLIVSPYISEGLIIVQSSVDFLM